MRLTILIAAFAMCGCAAKSSAPAANAADERRFQLCIVDPIAPGGMMTVSAIHVRSTNDTMLLQAKGRVRVAQAVAGPKVWKSGPLQLTAASGRLRFNPSGRPRAFAPGKISLLGVVGDLPVFANPADAAPMRPEIEALAASGSDLEQTLKKRPALRRRLDRVRTLYVPTNLSNCTFQTLTRAAAGKT
jgi:hypothetical protein